MTTGVYLRTKEFCKERSRIMKERKIGFQKGNYLEDFKSKIITLKGGQL